MKRFVMLFPLLFVVLPSPAAIDLFLTPQRRLLQTAERVLSTNNIYIDGTQYNYDCSGTIMAIYAGAGMNLLSLINRYNGGGVERMYALFDDNFLFYDGKFPDVGDLVFWDNSYDQNGDGLWNDRLTHIGMITSIKPDGTIYFIHNHSIRGIVIEQMNLLYPDDPQLNSYMRIADDNRSAHPELQLSGQLFNTFAKPYRLWKIQDDLDP